MPPKICCGAAELPLMAPLACCEAPENIELGFPAAPLPKFKFIVLEGVKVRLGGLDGGTGGVADCPNAGEGVVLPPIDGFNEFVLSNTDDRPLEFVLLFVEPKEKPLAPPMKGFATPAPERVGTFVIGATGFVVPESSLKLKEDWLAPVVGPLAALSLIVGKPALLNEKAPVAEGCAFGAAKPGCLTSFPKENPTPLAPEEKGVAFVEASGWPGTLLKEKVLDLVLSSD